MSVPGAVSSDDVISILREKLSDAHYENVILRAQIRAMQRAEDDGAPFEQPVE